MALFRGADEVVMAEIHGIGQVAEVLRHAVCEGLRIDTGGLGGLLDFLAVFVGACKEFDVETIQPLEPGKHVAGQRRIGVADMRRVVDVVDRRGQIIGLGG